MEKFSIDQLTLTVKVLFLFLCMYSQFIQLKVVHSGLNTQDVFREKQEKEFNILSTVFGMSFLK